MNTAVIVEGRHFSDPRWGRLFARHLAADAGREVRIDYVAEGNVRYPSQLAFDIVSPDPLLRKKD